MTGLKPALSGSLPGSPCRARGPLAIPEKMGAAMAAGECLHLSVGAPRIGGEAGDQTVFPAEEGIIALFPAGGDGAAVYAVGRPVPCHGQEG